VWNWFKVGDRYVLKKLESGVAPRWRRLFGHLLALDKHTTGDGIVPLCRQVRVRSGQTLAQLLSDVTVPANVDHRPPSPVKTGRPALTLQLKPALWKFGDTGRLLIRASGTAAARDGRGGPEQARRPMCSARIADTRSPLNATQRLKCPPHSDRSCAVDYATGAC
jgi:hypothetical protein